VTTTAHGSRGGPLAAVVGLTALASSVLYFVSDVIEVTQSGFSQAQLWLTLVAEAAIPLFVVGIYTIQRSRLGRLGQLSAFAYAYSFMFFTGTVVYALINHTRNWDALTRELGAVMMIHGAVFVVAGVGFGYAVTKARLFPPWTGIALIVGVLLIAISQILPAGVQLVGAGIRDLAFACMGTALLRVGNHGISHAARGAGAETVSQPRVHHVAPVSVSPRPS
jgi:hypothetical protein